MKFHHISWNNNLFPDKISLFLDENYNNYSFTFLKPEGEEAIEGIGGEVAVTRDLASWNESGFLELILFKRLIFQMSTFHTIEGKSMLESDIPSMEFD
jgi:hypothetical protein